MRHPHDKHLEKAWKHSREGYLLCQSNRITKHIVLKYISESIDTPQFKIWHEIISGGYQNHCEYLKNTESFFDLPQEEQNFWQIVQSHPFAVIFADREYEKIKKQRVA
jgi:hypothetical protein